MGVIFRVRENKEPNAIGYHDEHCRGCGQVESACLCPDYNPICSGFDYLDENDTPIPDEDLPDDFDECGACSYNLELATEIIKSCGDLSWLDRAQAAFILERNIDDFGLGYDAITAVQLDDLRIVKNERRMWEAQADYNRAQEANRPKR